jgi:hypothetical protein
MSEHQEDPSNCNWDALFAEYIDGTLSSALLHRSHCAWYELIIFDFQAVALLVCLLL